MNNALISRPGVAAYRFGHGFARLLRMAEIYRQRRALAALDQHALDDIGVTRTQAQAEARRPVWDAPDTWCS